MRKAPFFCTASAASTCCGAISDVLALGSNVAYEAPGASRWVPAGCLSFARLWESIRTGFCGPASDEVGEAEPYAWKAAPEDAGDANAAGDAKKVLFVCTANICRSPMAEAIFNALVSNAGMTHEARSAGVAALMGEPIAPNARAVLEESGVRTGEHRARQLDRAMLEEADLVLAMTLQHVAVLHHLTGGPSEKIRTLPGYAKGVPDAEGIADPYGMPISSYRASAREIFGYVDRVVRNLQG